MKFQSVFAVITLFILSACGGNDVRVISVTDEIDSSNESGVSDNIISVEESAVITDSIDPAINSSASENTGIQTVDIGNSEVGNQTANFTSTEDLGTSVTAVEADRNAIIETNVNPVVAYQVIDLTADITTEDRTRPAAGSVYSSNSVTLMSNGADLISNVGPQQVNAQRVSSWPGLRYGNFLVSNNAWNSSGATYPLWFQEISLFKVPQGYGVMFEWDWGAQADAAGSIFNTKSFPEVIYGTKSKGERSGSFADTGLPVELYNAPFLTLDYAYEYEGRPSSSSSASGTDSEFNIAIETFFHSSCDIERNGLSTDNVVMEIMVWLKAGQRKPSGDAPIGTFTSSDGKVFDIYTKLNSNPNYIAYVAQEQQASGSIEYSGIINDVWENSASYGIYQMKDSDCMANILFGTEIWHGAGAFRLNELVINRFY